ncbi:MAG: SCO family protein, partial [Ktedonobacteraceae bacterium]|nr:SCO family protein [Ktedonobacteraceae bacterium]
MSIRWNWRLASRLSVITLAVLVIILVTVLQQRSQAMTAAQQSGTESNNAYGLQGTDLNAAPSPDFRLTDQFGKPVAFSQFKGKPIVLTFLYTHCPDVCPLTAE